MRSTLSDVVERSSQEHSSQGRPSFDSVNLPTETSSSEHGYELRDMAVTDAIPRNPLPPHTPVVSPFARSQAFEAYRERLDAPRGPAASSSIARLPSPRPPRDFAEMRRMSGRGMSTGTASSELPPAESIPAGEDPASFVVQAALDKASRPSFQANLGGAVPVRGSSIPTRVRVSLDDAGITARRGESAVGSVTATLVRKRRRLPWKLLLAFGIVSCLCLVVAMTTLSIGIYNFTKLRAARAAKTIDQFSADVTPKIDAILAAVRGARRFLR